MSFKLRDYWVADHPKNGWEWVLYVDATDVVHREDAAIIWSPDRDGPFSLAIWSWVDEEYTDIENLPTLKEAKAMGKLLASIEAAKTTDF